MKKFINMLRNITLIELLIIISIILFCIFYFDFLR